MDSKIIKRDLENIEIQADNKMWFNLKKWKLWNTNAKCMNLIGEWYLESSNAD